MQIQFGRQLIVALLLIASSFVVAQAQLVLRVGDVVEVAQGSSWVQGRVESISGSIVKVRTGPNKYDFTNFQVPTTQIRAVGSAAREAKTNDLHEAFRTDPANRYLQAVRHFAPVYDDSFVSGGSPTTAAGWQETMRELGELDGLCKGKYAGVPNAQTHYLREGIVENRYAVWCEIAARRLELEPQARAAAAKRMISIRVADHLKFSFEHRKNLAHDETQMLMYDRARWRREAAAEIQPQFADYGIPIPADFFDAVEKRADELKQLIEQTAPNRAWEQPKWHDPAVEGFIRAKYAAEYRGARILKTGVSYPSWVEKKSLAYLGNDSTFRYYKVEYNSYKRGWILTKAPNQPFCLASEWAVGRGTKGMTIVFLGGSGIFMKCD